MAGYKWDDIEFVQEEVSASSDDEHDFEEHHNSVAPAYPLEEEDWQGWYSTDLWNMWDMLIDYSKSQGIHHNVLAGCEFSDFCQFVYAHSRHAAGKAT